MHSSFMTHFYGGPNKRTPKAYIRQLNLNPGPDDYKTLGQQLYHKRNYAFCERDS